MKPSKNIHVLPTNKPSRLYINARYKHYEFCELPRISTEYKKCHNIYIISDEALPYDSSIFDSGAFYHRDAVGDVYIITKHTFKPNPHFCKRIILTTDQDLIKDGVQAIDDEFLEWFVKNPSCEEVDTSKIKTRFRDEWRFEYKIIIPKEEPKQHLTDMMKGDEELGLYEEPKFVTVNMESATGEDLGRVSYIPIPNVDYIPKQEILLEDVFNEEKKKGVKELIDKQETLEEAYNKIYKSIDFTEFDFASFAIGVKHQQERSYSEEEVKNIVDETIEKFYKHFYTLTKAEMKKQWFEQFKKK